MASMTVLSGPSGVGKSVVIKNLFVLMPHLKWSVSYTTRGMRTGEVNHQTYHFISHAEFQRLIDTRGFVEWAPFNGHKYGTPFPPDDTDVLVENAIDLDAEDPLQGMGSLAIKRNYPAATLIWIMPPGRYRVVRLAVLAVRMIKRHSERPWVMVKRLRIGWKEMTVAHQYYDYVVVNRNAKKAAKQIQQILTAAA